MEELRIHIKTYTVIRKGIGVLFFINGVSWFFGHLHEMKLMYWFLSITNTVLGIIYFITGFGSDTSILQAGDGFIKIRWMNWLRSVTIQDTEIEKIKLTRVYVLVNRRGKKAIKLNIDPFERDQKKEVYEFMMEYTKQKNLELETNFNSPL